jgi:hypothetical protein
VIDCTSATVFGVSQHTKRMFLVSKFCHREGSALEPLCLTIFIPYAWGLSRPLELFFVVKSHDYNNTGTGLCAVTCEIVYGVRITGGQRPEESR